MCVCVNVAETCKSYSDTVLCVQSSTSEVSTGKKKCTKNVSVLIPEVLDEEPVDTVITIDDDIASVHTSGINSAVDSSCVTPEVLSTL